MSGRELPLHQQCLRASLGMIHESNWCASPYALARVCVQNHRGPYAQLIGIPTVETMVTALIYLTSCYASTTDY
jgi:hypothetical protein